MDDGLIERSAPPARRRVLVRELELVVPGADGPMTAFAAVPGDAGTAPGVLVFMDVFGPREELRDICRRFAASGYVAVLPHLYHRLGSAVFAPMNRRDDPMPPGAQEANAATTMAMTARDAAAVIAHADAGHLGMRVPMWGAIGYCMGGRHAVSCAVTNPQRVRAAVSAHGGRLVTGDDDSPHRLIQGAPIPLYFAFARDDETCPDEHQEIIRAAAHAANVAGAEVRCERLDALHGWSFPERWCFDRAASEHVWERTLRMFRAALWTTHGPLESGPAERIDGR